MSQDELISINDAELDAISGGLTRKIFGTTLTVITSGTKCFNGKYSPATYIIINNRGGLYKTWAALSSEGTCGNCQFLYIDKGVGVCGCSNKNGQHGLYARANGTPDYIE